MKKILTILAASAMFFAFGEDISNGINFEAYTAYGEGSFNPLGDDPGTESQYWYSASSVGNVISNHVAAPVLPSGVTVPDLFKDDNSNTNFLYLETESPLFRTVKTNSHDPNEFGNSGVLVTESPIYLDTLVKFTAADSAFTSFEDAADKIAIEYVEHEEESHEDPELGLVIDSAGFTNFVIRAGYVVAADNSATIVETNYYAAVPEGFDKDAWHRLTVRSIANIDGTGTGKGHVGFVVYLDQVPLKYATSVAVGNATFESNLNADVTKNFYNSETPIHALYPSAVDPEELTGQKISAVAFSGNGSVDDVVFTTTKPGFINESSIVTVTWDEHVATLTLNGNAVEGFVAGTAGNANVEPENGVVLVDVTFASGWEAGTFTTDGDGSWDSATSSFVDLASGEICNIVSMQPLYSVSAGGTTTKYDDLDLAMAAAVAAGTAQAPATFKLLADCNKVLGFTEGYIVLDLNGCDVQGGDDDACSILNSGAETLIITNSGAEASVLVPTNPYADPPITLLAAAGLTIVQAGTFEGMVVPAGENILTITGGKFLDVAGTFDPADPTTFYLVDPVNCVAPGVVCTKSGDYVQVGDAAPQPPIGTYTVTVTPNANATYAAAYNDGGAAVEFVNDVAAVTVGQTITITATPAGGYEYASVPTGGWTAGQDGKITIEVSAEATVAIPEPTAVVVGTYEVVVTPASNADYAAVYTNDGSTVTFTDNIVTVAVHYAIMITATPKTGYEYATTPDGWTAGQDGKITIVVDAEATVAIPEPTAKSNYPSYITGHDDYKGKYDTWAQTYGADTGSAYEAAFLLNVAPSATDPELKPTAITISGSTVTITANQNLTSVNGKVYVKVATTLAGLSTAEWAEATLSEGKVQVTPGSSDTAGFYKIKVDF